jgi:hypothetical protein
MYGTDRPRWSTLTDSLAGHRRAAKREVDILERRLSTLKHGGPASPGGTCASRSIMALHHHVASGGTCASRSIVALHHHSLQEVLVHHVASWPCIITHVLSWSTTVALHPPT